MSSGEDLLATGRRAGDLRLSSAGRDLFRRMTTGDLADEFQAMLDADTEVDPLLGGG